MSKSKKLSDLNHRELVDFDVVHENWHVYELEDNSIIRAKNVLMSVLDVGSGRTNEGDKSGLRKYSFGIKLLLVVNSPKHLRRAEVKEFLVSELEKFIVQRNLKFRQIKDGGNSEYETKKSKITIMTRVRQIDKTSKYDPNGNPAYIVRTENQVLLELKEKPEETKT